MKSGFIALIGKPNAGKSTLINTLLNKKVAIATYKAQTTRNSIQGILNRDNLQIVFVDTPGIHEAKNYLGSYMNKEAYAQADGADIIFYLVDATKGLNNEDKEVLNKLFKFDIPVFSTKETFDAMPKHTEKLNSNNIKYFNIAEKFDIKDLEILPFSIPHDAANPCGFTISKQNGQQLSIATDIGHMTNSIVKNLEGSSFILLESNYDTEVLKCCSYPFTLKSRIAGSTGHLSNSMAGKTISYLSVNGNLQTAMLGHLSKESNFPELAYQTVVDEIISNNGNNSLSLSVASRDNPGKLITL